MIKEKLSRKISLIFLCLTLVGLFSGCSVSSVTKSPEIPTSTRTISPTTTPTNTLEPSDIPTPTDTALPTSTSTLDLFDLPSIGFPLHILDVICLKSNFGAPTDYGDFTHDGVDIVVTKEHEVDVLAVADGVITQSNFVNEVVGYELYIYHGKNQNGEKVFSNYVHLDSAIPIHTEVKKGDVIGTIKNPHGGGTDHILYFGIRVGETSRFESPSDGAQGDEVDVTDILIKYLTPEQISDDY